MWLVNASNTESVGGGAKLVGQSIKPIARCHTFCVPDKDWA